MLTNTWNGRAPRTLGTLLTLAALAAPAAAQSGGDLAALALEVTQGVQDLNHSVRLVGGKRTFVRFYVQTAQGTVTTPALLTARSGERSVALAPLNRGGVIQAVAAPNRLVRDHAFLFELPDGFREGDVSLEAEVNNSADGRAVEEPDYTNNVARLNVRFETVPPLHLVIFSIGYRDADGNYFINDDSHVRAMANWIYRAWPVPNVRYWLRKDDISKSIGPGLPTCDQVNALLAKKRLEDRQNPNTLIPASARYYGMVDDRGGFMRGCADDLPGFASSGPTGVAGAGTNFEWDTDGTYGDWYGAHEVAHNYARFHAEFCGAAAGERYPFANGNISPVLGGADAVYGFDSLTRAVLAPNWKDNMTYCNFQWTGKHTYHGIMDLLQREAAAVAAAAKDPGVRRAESREDRLMVVGGVDLDQTPPKARMSPFYLLQNATEVRPRVPGDYAIVLKAGDAELARYPFTPARMSSGAGKNPNDPELNLRSIRELVPYATGTTVVDIIGPGNALLHSVKAGPAFPEVQLTSPAEGDRVSGDVIKVTWTATDADGDTLVYTVQYSSDNGLTWETVEQNLRDTTAEIDRIDLSGSPTALFRVLATDGIHTTAATSKPFVLGELGPTVEILSPAKDEAFVKGETVYLEAIAYDADTGEVPEEMVSWTSSIDGPLGTGLELEVSRLSPGDHTLTLTVKDDAGLDAVSVTTQIKVVAKAADLPVIADQLIVEPEVIILNTLNGETSEVFGVFNRNTRGALSWTATVDQPWITLDASSGATPAAVKLSVGDTSSWTTGSRTAVVTVTTAEGLKSSLRVQVQK